MRYLINYKATLGQGALRTSTEDDNLITSIVLFFLAHVHRSDQENIIEISRSQEGYYLCFGVLESRQMANGNGKPLHITIYKCSGILS